MSAEQSFTFKRVTEEDLPLLHQWFQEEHVKKWWPVPKEMEEFLESFLKRIRSTEITPYLVMYKDTPIGYLQSYLVDRSKETWLPSLPKNTLGIDQFIGEVDYIGKGYGTLFIKEFLNQLEAQNEGVTVILDPEPENLAAIRCYEKVGFVRVGEYERTGGGQALVMRYN